MEYTFDWGSSAFLILPVSLAFTVVASLVILKRYRRAVLQSMQGESSENGSVSVDSSRSPGPDTLLHREPTPVRDATRSLGRERTSDRLHVLSEANWRQKKLAFAYLVAGFVLAVVLATFTVWADRAFSETIFVNTRNIIVQSVLLSWALVPTILYIMPLTTLGRVAALLVYPVALLILILLEPLVTARQVIMAALALHFVPTTLSIVLGSRWLKATAPFIFAITFTSGLGALFALWMLFQTVLTFGSWLIGLLVFGILLIPVAIIGLSILPIIARFYRRKAISDQTLLIASWWLIFTSWVILLAASSAGTRGLIGLIAWLAALGVLLVALRLAESGRASGRPAKLLLLRVFGEQGSDRVLTGLERDWRHLGSIQLLGGPDLATATLEPHEFLDYVTGRLARRFVKNESDVTAAMENTDWAADPDGRYRVNEIYCQDGMWRLAFSKLARESDVVLMDLRGFSRANRGVIFELGHLINNLEVARVTLLADDTTDMVTLQEVVAEAWEGMDTRSPNYGRPNEIPVYRLRKVDFPSLRGLIERLCDSMMSTPGVPSTVARN
jgi:hypothetical protein